MFDTGDEEGTAFCVGYATEKVVEAIVAKKVADAMAGPKVEKKTKNLSIDYTNFDEGVNFSSSAMEHMGEKARYVPVQTLRDAIKVGDALPDPRGSSATMYYTIMYKNGKMFNLEVLYEESTNTIYHFEYARKPMGNLPAIRK